MDLSCNCVDLGGLKLRSSSNYPAPDSHYWGSHINSFGLPYVKLAVSVMLGFSPLPITFNRTFLCANVGGIETKADKRILQSLSHHNIFFFILREYRKQWLVIEGKDET